METNIIGLVLGIILIIALAAFVALSGAYLYLMTQRPCPHCKTMMSKKAATCPHCGKGILVAS